MKTNLLGYDREKLSAFFASLGEPVYRAKQLLQWVHAKGVIRFADMHTFPKDLRIKLESFAQLAVPTVVNTSKASDNTTKWSISTSSHLGVFSHVEMVRIVHNGRITLCISSQAGCVVGCRFCVTGKQGFSHDLTAAEIIGQLWLAQHALDTPIDSPITNVVFMGMGEPLLNTKNVLQASRIMTDDLGYGLSKRKVTISTSGIVPAIHALCGKTEVALAISLHAADDSLRDMLVPINKKYPINVLLKAATAYLKSLSTKRFITFEYTIIAGVNDSVQQARALARLLQCLPCKINVIPYNQSPTIAYTRPIDTTINAFVEVLQISHTVTVRRTRGEATQAACGQLAGNIQSRVKPLRVISA